MNSSFWKDRSVFITGHTGFKGTWLSLWLTELGAKVSGFSLPPPTNPSLSAAINGTNFIFHSEIGSINDLHALQKAVQSAAPEVVFHLAAQPLVRESYRNPAETFQTNVMGTVNLLESIRRVSSVKAIVLISSDKCYENRGIPIGYVEEDPLGGHDPYSASKGAMEIVSASYRRSFFEPLRIGIATARAGNVIGGGDWSSDRLIPDLARAFSEKKVAMIRNPQAVRPWQHVLDPLSGYILLAEALYSEPDLFGKGWNFGPDPAASRTVGKLATQFATAWSPTAEWDWDRETASFHETDLLYIDSSKAKDILGWSNRLNFEHSVSSTARWYLSFYSRKRSVSLLNITLDEIGLFVKNSSASSCTKDAVS